jgi:hypothetical protein
MTMFASPVPGRRQGAGRRRHETSDAFAPRFDVVEVDQEPTVNLRKPRPPTELTPAEHGEEVDGDVITSARRVAAGSW